MKILLLAERFGHGHLKAAQNLQKALLNLVPTLEVEVLSTLGLIDPKIENFAADLYLKILNHTPEIWGFLYEKGHDKEKDHLRWVVALLYKKKLQEIVKDYQPDGIINTHAFPAIALDYLGYKNYATVITDYDYHAFWLTKNSRFYYVAAEKIRNRLLDKGFTANQVLAFGPPVDPIFTKPLAEDTIRKEYNIPATDKIILIMGGGLGLGPIAEVASLLAKVDKKWTVISLCGHNQKLYQKLKAFEGKNLIPVPFTSRVPHFLKAANIVLTKPGGLSTAEALALGKPIFILNPLPGQEERNAKFLVESGAALYIKDVGELVLKIKEAFLPENYQRLSQNALRLGHKDAAFNIARHFLQYFGETIFGGDIYGENYVSS